jgi:hypothetical protein
MTTQLWIQDTTGEVTCKDHAGHYLKSAIVANPKRISYWTELGTWDSYYTHLIGGENLQCETCKELAVA